MAYDPAMLEKLRAQTDELDKLLGEQLERLVKDPAMYNRVNSLQLIASASRGVINQLDKGNLLGHADRNLPVYVKETAEAIRWLNDYAKRLGK